MTAGVAFEAAFGVTFLMCDAFSRALLLLGSLSWLALSRSPGLLFVVVVARVEIDLVAVGGVDIEAGAISLRTFVADRSSLVAAVSFPRVSMARGG